MRFRCSRVYQTNEQCRKIDRNDTSSLFPLLNSSLFTNEAHERHQSLLRERQRLDGETRKLLSEYISIQNFPEYRHMRSWAAVSL